MLVLSIVQRAGLIVLLALFFHVLVIIASCFALPDSMSTLDTEYAAQTIFAAESQFAVYLREPLSAPGKEVVFVGASNAREWFRPEQFSDLLPNINVHNIAVSSSDMRQQRELVQLVLSAVPKENLANLTIVLGIWYGSFVDEDRRWKGQHTDVVSEMLRYNLYREDGDRLPIARFSAEQMHYAALLIRPFMLASRLDPSIFFSENFERLVAFIVGEGAIPPISSCRNQHVITKDEQDRAITHWEEYMGRSEDWSNKSFDTLYQIAKEVSSVGARLVLIDMPIPNWHRERVSYDRIYQMRFVPYLARMSFLSGFSYGNLREEFSDKDYYFDSAHPRPRVTRLFASKVSQTIRTALSNR